MAELVLDNVSVEYPLYNAPHMLLRRRLLSIGTGGKIAQTDRSFVSIRALEQINLTLRYGDRVGLIGHNGAGKSTLLRTMAGIYTPTQGKITSTGRISTVFDISAGLQNELTGYENIIRIGLLNGLNKLQLQAAMSDIEEFTDLGDFLSVPVRTYSSGMITRLLFAIATAAHPEILLIDEIIGTGDAAFQQRAEQRLEQFLQKAAILVLSSHSEQILQKFCKTILVLEHGRIIDQRLV